MGKIKYSILSEQDAGERVGGKGWEICTGYQGRAAWREEASQ